MITGLKLSLMLFKIMGSFNEPHFDHLVIFVADLDAAITDFTDLGFNVSRGGSHGLTENALIIFSNQTYIELFIISSGC